jgi:hypothetical protein
VPLSKAICEVRTDARSGDTRIKADIDGDGVADIAVILTGTFAMTAADFVL